MKEKIRVQVRRDFDGRVYSVVRPYPYKEQDGRASLTIDREKGRALDEAGVVGRAKKLAEVIECKIDIDLKQPCKALKEIKSCDCEACAEYKKSKGGVL